MLGRGGHNSRRVSSLKPRTVMSSIMRARSGLMGRDEVSDVIGFLSRAEGCWTFDARDRMPQPSRATAHHPTGTRAPLPRERVRCVPGMFNGSEVKVLYP